MQEFCSKIKKKGVNVMIQQVADCLKQARVPFPAAFRGIMLFYTKKWSVKGLLNPTVWISKTTIAKTN